jgi:hypothetical protein
MGVPAKGYNAYHHDKGFKTKVKPPGRVAVEKKKRAGQASTTFKSGFDAPSGKPTTKRNRKFN